VDAAIALDLLLEELAHAARGVSLFNHLVGAGEQLPKRTLSEFAVVP
jgi:hypothetical protein